MQHRDGVIVAMVYVPSDSDAAEFIGHELQDVLEQTRGCDYEVEATLIGCMEDVRWI